MTVACQAPLSMEFSRQKYLSGLPFFTPGDLDPGIESGSPAWWADSLPAEPQGKPQNSLELMFTEKRGTHSMSDSSRC